MEEYKRPTFEAKLLDPEKPLRLNQPAELKGEARYYFGLPVTAGKARWRVVRSPVYPWWWGYFYTVNSQETVVATGESRLDDKGHFIMRFTPEADERLAKGEGRAVSYRYAVSADVTDEGVVMHVDLAWEVEDIQTFVACAESRAVATWQTPLSQQWQGVEVLDVEEEWLPLGSELHQAWTRQWRSRTTEPWSWVTEGDGSQTVLRGSGSVIRHSRGAWERLSSVKAILGASVDDTIPLAVHEALLKKHLSSWRVSTITNARLVLEKLKK